MNFEEFINPEESVQAESQELVAEEPDELDVQRTVVESLAAEKAEQEEQLAALRERNIGLENEISRLQDEKSKLDDKIAALNKKLCECRAASEKVGDILAKNSERTESSQVALLDRDINLQDRFPGETRDHVLEVLREARDAAEKEGRIRRAQLLEGVLVANEPSGELANQRKKLEALFSENGNIVSGPVIAELTKRGISHKNGEEYLLPAEIIKRAY